MCERPVSEEGTVRWGCFSCRQLTAALITKWAAPPSTDKGSGSGRDGKTKGKGEPYIPLARVGQFDQARQVRGLPNELWPCHEAGAVTPALPMAHQGEGPVMLGRLVGKDVAHSEHVAIEFACGGDVAHMHVRMEEEVAQCGRVGGTVGTDRGLRGRSSTVRRDSLLRVQLRKREAEAATQGKGSEHATEKHDACAWVLESIALVSR